MRHGSSAWKCCGASARPGASSPSGERRPCSRPARPRGELGAPAAATQREWAPATLPASPLAAVVVARPARAARLERLPDSAGIAPLSSFSERARSRPPAPAPPRSRRGGSRSPPAPAESTVGGSLANKCRTMVRVTSRRPDEQDQRYGDDCDHGLEGQPQPPIVAEVVAARAHHQQVRLMTDRRQKRS